MRVGRQYRRWNALPRKSNSPHPNCPAWRKRSVEDEGKDFGWVNQQGMKDDQARACFAFAGIVLVKRFPSWVAYWQGMPIYQHRWPRTAGWRAWGMLRIRYFMWEKARREGHYEIRGHYKES